MTTRGVLGSRTRVALALPMGALLGAVLCGGCAPETVLLAVDLRTDLLPVIEIAEVETILTTDGATAGTTVPHEVDADADYVGAVRIAEFRDVTPGVVLVAVRLRAADGSLVMERRVRVAITGTRVVTVVATRDCRGVTCPMAGDDPDATACVGARCVSPDCSPETPESCEVSSCAATADCTRASSCARFECIDGACLARPTPGACTEFEYCGIERGCVPLDETCLAGAACDTGTRCEIGRIDCSTGAPLCRAQGPSARGEPCRDARDACDAPETCDGTSTACPADELAPAGTPCAEGYCNGLGTCAPCTAGEACSAGDVCQLGRVECTSGAPVCVAAGAAPAGTPCRASAGDCDVGESCDGAATSCPVDGFAPPSTVCRAATAACDRAELCTGSSASCPIDALASAGTECRPTTRACDGAELCDGTMLACPPDAALETGCSTELRSAGTTMYAVPAGCTRLRVRAWGASGGRGGGSANPPGAGGFADATLDVTPGEMLTVVVGAPGANGASGMPGAGGAPGGGGGGNGGSQAGGGGGGYSGVFRGGMTRANAVLIGGGGAGSGGGNSAETGAGGGAAGQAGWLCTGGTQTAGGMPSTGGTAGAALAGGTGGTRAGGDGGGGGGGGYFGGGGGSSASTDAGGGGGGSGFAAAGATSVTLTAGNRATPGNAGDPLRMGAGASVGAVLLDCL